LLSKNRVHFCLFGIRNDKYRLAKLMDQEPVLADYVLRGGEFNEMGKWQPNGVGLGYWFIVEWLNIHGHFGIFIPDKEKYVNEYGSINTKEHLRY